MIWIGNLCGYKRNRVKPVQFTLHLNYALIFIRNFGIRLQLGLLLLSSKPSRPDSRYHLYPFRWAGLDIPHRQQTIPALLVFWYSFMHLRRAFISIFIAYVSYQLIEKKYMNRTVYIISNKSKSKHLMISNF